MANSVERMISDALKLADPFYWFHVGGQRLRISQCIHDMAGYEQLTDSILRQIRMTSDPNLAPARDILERVPLTPF